MKRLGHRRCWPRRPQSQRPMRSRGVVVRGVPGKHLTEVSLTEDQHPVGYLGPRCQDEAFGEAVRPRTVGRDLDHLDTDIGQYRVERGRELPAPIADEEPEPRDVFAQVHEKVAGLLGGPGPVGMPGHAQHVQGAVTNFECEQDVEPPQLRACWVSQAPWGGR